MDSTRAFVMRIEPAPYWCLHSMRNCSLNGFFRSHFRGAYFAYFRSSSGTSRRSTRGSAHPPAATFPATISSTARKSTISPKSASDPRKGQSHEVGVTLSVVWQISIDKLRVWRKGGDLGSWKPTVMVVCRAQDAKFSALSFICCTSFHFEYVLLFSTKVVFVRLTWWVVT